MDLRAVRHRVIQTFRSAGAERNDKLVEQLTHEASRAAASDSFNQLTLVQLAPRGPSCPEWLYETVRPIDRTRRTDSRGNWSRWTTSRARPGSPSRVPNEPRTRGAL